MEKKCVTTCKDKTEKCATNHCVTYIPERAILKIHESQNLIGEGYQNKTNFDFMLNTITDFYDDPDVTINSQRDLIEWTTAYYLFHIASGHVFSDGNKRTAFLTATIFLMANGCIPKYQESSIKRELDSIYEKMDKEKISFIEATKKIPLEKQKSLEFQLVKLLFELAGANPDSYYTSPKQIKPIISKLIDEANEQSLKENSQGVTGFVDLFKRILKL